VRHPYGERTEGEDAWSECMATEVKPLQEQIKQLESRISELEKMKSDVAALLEKMVCTEGIDAGVIFMDSQGVTKYDPKLNCHVYQHEHFSELGDALIGLWKIVSPDSVPEGGK